MGALKMAVLQNKERVSLSFHYMDCVDKSDESKKIAITHDEFTGIYKGLSLHRSREEDYVKINQFTKIRDLINIKMVERIDSRTIAGLFENPYTGHSFRNTDKGHISASSLNYRPFVFLLYLADSGRLYIACQYLGNYGGYTGIKSLIESLINSKNKFYFHSFNMFLVNMNNLIPKEVIFQVSKKPKNINGHNVFGQSVGIVLKDREKDEGYQNGVKSQILSLFRSPQDKIRRELKKFLSANELMSIRDDELEDCRVIVEMNKKRVTINMLEENNYATKYVIDVPLEPNGHPNYSLVVDAAIKTLREEIISQNENV
jgi:hypothetical protein